MNIFEQYKIKKYIFYDTVNTISGKFLLINKIKNIIFSFTIIFFFFIT